MLAFFTINHYLFSSCAMAYHKNFNQRKHECLNTLIFQEGSKLFVIFFKRFIFIIKVNLLKLQRLYNKLSKELMSVFHLLIIFLIIIFFFLKHIFNIP